VEKATERDETGGYLRTRLARVAQLRADLPAVYWPNQCGNLDAAADHYALTGATLAGHPSECANVPDVRVVAVDADGSMIFGGRPRRR
jgi:cysteine synthase A